MSSTPEAEGSLPQETPEPPKAPELRVVSPPPSGPDPSDSPSSDSERPPLSQPTAGPHPTTGSPDAAGSTATGPQLRASDAERQATVHVLQDAVARGLLSFDEGSERMAAAYAARFVRDLPPLTADLPPQAAPAAGPPGWQRVWTVLAEQLRAELAIVMAGGLRSPRSRRTVLVGLILVVTLLTVGSLASHGLFGGGDPHPFRDGFGPEGFHHR